MALPVTLSGIVSPIVGPFKTNAGAVVNTFSGNRTAQVEFGNTTIERVGQSFSPPSNTLVAAIRLCIGHVPTATDTVVCDIYAADGLGLPTGSILGTSDAISPSAMGTGAQSTCTFIFSTPVVVTGGIKYAAVCRRTSNLSSFLNDYFCSHVNANLDGGQNGSQYGGGAWSQISSGFDFPIIVGGSDAYLMFGKDSATATTLQAYKAIDPSISWTSVATQAGFTTGIQYLSAVQAGTYIYLLITDGSGTSVNIKCVIFDMMTETFSSVETVHSAFNPQSASGSNMYQNKIEFRSDGQAVAFYQGPQVSVMGSGRGRVVAKRRSVAGSWGSADTTNNPTPIDAGGAIDYNAIECIMGASDRIHFHYVDLNTPNAITRSLSSANALDTAQNIGTGESFGLPSDEAQAVSYNSAGTQKIVSVFYRGNATAALKAHYYNSGANPTPSAVTIEASASGAYPCRLFNDGASVYVLYRDPSDEDLYVEVSTDHGATWSTKTDVFGSGAVIYLSRDGNVFLRGTSVVIPFIVNDNGTLKYNEYTVRTTGADITPALFADSDAFYSAAVSPGAVGLSPSLFAEADTFFSATGNSVYRLTPGLFSNSDTLYTAAVTQAAPNLRPSLYSDGDAFYSPTLTPGAVGLTPALFSEADAFSSSNVTAAYALTPALFSNGPVFQSAAVAAGAVNLAPGLLIDADIFYSPNASGPVHELAPALYAEADAFYSAGMMSSAGLTANLNSDGDIFYAPNAAARAGVTASRLDDGDAFYAATVLSSIALAAALYSGNGAFYGHVLEGGEERRAADSWIIPVNRRRRRK